MATRHYNVEGAEITPRARTLTGGTLDGDQSRQLIEAVPNVELYRWTNKESEHQGGRVHAKIALADPVHVGRVATNGQQRGHG
jgi:hypothetical protein